MAKYKTRDQGFTLIELTIVILIAGLLIAMFGSFLTNYNTNIKNAKLRSDMELISNAIQNYLEANQKLPCPAYPTLGLDNASFGTEAQINCSGLTNGTNGLQTNGAGINSVVIGSIPVRALNLPDEYMIDPWGYRYTYAVTEDLADGNSDFTSGTGALDIEDASGNSLVSPAGQGAYIVISHGRNGVGSYTIDGNAYLACGSSTANETENCDNNNTFVSTLINSEDGANYFDDTAVYQGKSFLAPNIPQGAVMAFDLTTCPSGWSVYSAATGRTIIGTGDTSTIANAYHDPAGATDVINIGSDYATSMSSVETSLDPSGTQASLSQGEYGGSPYRIASDPLLHGGSTSGAYTNMPPFIALTYCRKD